MPESSPRRRRSLVGGALLAISAATAVLPTAADGAADADPSAQLELPQDASVVDGTDPGAPDGLAPGWSRTELAGPSAARYFTYTRAHEGGAVFVTAAAPGASPTSAEGFRIDVATSDGTTCDSGFTSRSEGDRGLVVTNVGVYPGDPDDPSSSEETCRDASTLRLTVARGSSDPVAATDVWLWVVEESPLADDAGLRAQESATAGPVDVGGPAEERHGSTDIATAPLLESGIWRGSVPAGGDAAYRVRLGFGQTVRAEAVAGALSEQEASDYSFSTQLSLAIRSPLLDTEHTTGGTDSLGREPAVARAAAGPVAYPNRFESGTGPALPGEYLVVVSYDVDDDVDLDEVDYTLRVSVEGEDATPDFAQTPAYLSGETATDMIQFATPTPPAEGGGRGAVVRYVGGALLVVVGLGAAGAGALQLRRRQTNTIT